MRMRHLVTVTLTIVAGQVAANVWYVLNVEARLRELEHRDIDAVVPVLVKHAEIELAARVFESVRAKSFQVVDDLGNERAFIGVEEAPEAPGGATKVRLSSPNGGREMGLVASESGAALWIDRRATIYAVDAGCGLQFFESAYAPGVPSVVYLRSDTLAAGLYLGRDGVPTSFMETTDNVDRIALADNRNRVQATIEASPNQTMFGVFHEGVLRNAIGVRAGDGKAFSEQYNSDAGLVYAVQTVGEYPTTYLKKQPGDLAWSAASAVSTILTYLQLRK